MKKALPQKNNGRAHSVTAKPAGLDQARAPDLQRSSTRNARRIRPLQRRRPRTPLQKGWQKTPSKQKRER